MTDSSRVTPGSSPPEIGATCPRCNNGLVVPIVYGLPDPWSTDGDPDEVILGGCVVGDGDRGCRACGQMWSPLESETSSIGHEEQVGEPDVVVDDLPADADDLAEEVVAYAVDVEHRGQRLAGLGVAALGLWVALEEVDLPAGSREAAAWHRSLIEAGIARVDEAEPIVRRVLDRVSDLMRDADDTRSAEEEAELYERILTIRLHLPIACEQVDDAEFDVVRGVRGLARVAAGVAALAPSGPAAEKLARHARGVLRLHLPDGEEPVLADDGDELWSTSLDTLTLEVAGLLANLMADHREFLIAGVGDEGCRYVQCITYESGLHCESVGDQYCEAEPLTEADRARLVALGWSPPVDDSELVNWHRRFAAPVAIGDAARLLVQTLVEVHHLVGPADLVLQIQESE